MISDAVRRGVDGIVVEALGLGNVPGNVTSAIEYAIDHDVVVVVTTRCRSGVVSAVYGSEGGGRVLDQMDVIFESFLSAHKARLKLLVALTAYEDVDEIKKAFDSRRYKGHGYRN
jgi:L-asparaginase